MRLAVLDFLNQDYGINVLLQNSPIFTINDRYVFDEEVHINRTKYCEIRFDIENITDKNYDILIVISNMYDSCSTYRGKQKEGFSQRIRGFIDKTVDIINQNKFKRVIFADNYDYDYDPNSIFIENENHRTVMNKDIVFLKRNFDKCKVYNINVFPFPYLIFGKECNIHLLLNRNTSFEIPNDNHIYFAGTLFHHIDNDYGINRDRKGIFERIQNTIPELLRFQMTNYEEYIQKMKQSKFCLDLLGVGNPNIRTFEILHSGSLRIAQRSTLKWNFDDDFCEETYFDNETDLREKIYNLINDDELYRKCLDKQNYIVSTYMNSDYLSNYIITVLNSYFTT